MTLDELNSLSFEAAYVDFQKCCGAKNWVRGIVDRRPFRSSQEVFDSADTIWKDLSSSDWKEAFEHHPTIGDLDGLKQKSAPTAKLAEEEQAGIQTATDDVLQRLAERNQEYEEKFGYIFIVCATGKSAEEMLRMLEERLSNHPDQELTIAAEEQRKITKIRLEKMLG
ncbi:MAG: 2-oxo-4-hydroxy-4-carboxy-5-ureidoimidazoline decarboxylase [Ignavibacteriales bacterium]|nr:2-oxo-4-hydroxy-4-carboxy-5-ureidoimidazoline decarboxylase [Ignavibacteriales bacterium]